MYSDELLMNIYDTWIFGDPISGAVPEEILGIEVYNEANAPMRYSRGLARGVILIWTREK